MREVYKNLYCGNVQDWLNVDREYYSDITAYHTVGNWAALHACKEPFHRQFVGYIGRGCPKESPEYLWAERGNRLALNIVDAPKPEFFDKGMIDKALGFIDEKLKAGMKVLVHCNVGESRSASICLLYLTKHGILKGDTFSDCEVAFMNLYPEYNPGAGIYGFMKEHWSEYRG